MRMTWQTLRRINNDILGVKGLISSNLNSRSDYASAYLAIASFVYVEMLSLSGISLEIVSPLRFWHGLLTLSAFCCWSSSNQG